MTVPGAGRLLDRAERVIYTRLGGPEWGGNESPPGDNLGIEVGEPDDDGRPLHVVRSMNDGSELWLGYRTAWQFHCSMADARRIAWFVLWTCWARGTWFGLRSALWYWALHRSVQRHTRRITFEYERNGVWDEPTETTP